MDRRAFRPPSPTGSRRTTRPTTGWRCAACWWRWTNGCATGSRRRRAGIHGCRTGRWSARPTWPSRLCRPSDRRERSPPASAARIVWRHRMEAPGRRCRCSCRRSIRMETSAPESVCPRWRCRWRPIPAGTSASRRSARPISCFRCWDRTWRLPPPEAERESAHDPRPAIDERYPTREQYLTLVQEAGAGLVKDRYLLADDLADHRQARRRALGSAHAQGGRRRPGRGRSRRRRGSPSDFRPARLQRHRRPPAPRRRACRP